MLEERLLRVGGARVALPGELPEWLLDAEVEWKLDLGAEKLLPGAPGACHAMAALRYKHDGLPIVHGFVLRTDPGSRGAWMEHSWNLDRPEGGRVVDSPPAALVYYGLPLNEEQSAVFCWSAGVDLVDHD